MAVPGSDGLLMRRLTGGAPWAPTYAAEGIRHPWRIWTALGISLLSLIACDPDGPGEPPAVTFDTLSGGAIHVQNAGAGAWSEAPDTGWRLVEDLRIGRQDGSGPEVFGRVRSVVVDALDRMWVVDGLANEVRVFDEDGDFVRTIGRRGSGPGEFMRIGPAFHGPDGEIWVEDLSLSRWERFDTTGARVGGLRSTSRIGGAMRLWTRDDRFLVVDLDPNDPETGVFVEHRRAGPDSLATVGTFGFPEISEPDLVASGARAGMPVPFTPLPGMQLSSAGDVWVSYGGPGYRIHRQTLGGDTLQVIERAFDPAPVPDSMRERAIAELTPDGTTGDAAGTVEIPRVFPPFDEFHVSSDGSLWVLRSLAEGAAGFDVFEADGRYLGQPEVPADLASMRIESISAEYIYAVATDSLGVDYVVRLEVQREAPNSDPGAMAPELTPWDSVPEITLEPELRIDGASADLSWVGGIAVAGDGSMAVSQPWTSSLVVFDARGGRIGRFGSGGNGVGEFATIGGFGWLGDTLWVYDLAREQLAYGRTLPARIIRTERLPRDAVVDSSSVGVLPESVSRILPLALYADGSIYARSILPGEPPEFGLTSVVRRYVRMNPSRRVSRLVAEVPGTTVVQMRTATGRHSVVVPFLGAPLHEVSPDGGRIATVKTHIEGRHGGWFEVVLQESLGDTVYARAYPFIGVPIPPAFADSIFEARVARIDNSERARLFREEAPIPPVYFPLTSLAVSDDGKIWLGLRSAGENPNHLVLDSRGAPLGVATLPGSTRVVAANGRNVWGAEGDSDEVGSVVRFRVEAMSREEP